MAHDRQYKDDDDDGMPDVRVVKFDCPKKGQQYFARATQTVVTATEDMTERFLIVEVRHP